MGRIIPPQQNPKRTTPSWLNIQKVVEAGAFEVQNKQEALQKVAASTFVTSSYVCSNCSNSFYADNPALQAQANLLARAGKEIAYECPNCKNPLQIGQTLAKIASADQAQATEFTTVTKDLRREQGGTYNTYANKHIIYRALDELQKYATKVGMIMARVRYLKSESDRKAGQDYPVTDKVDCEIEWTFGRKQKARVTASLTIDQAGQIKFPSVFKTADNVEHPFTKEIIKELEKSADFMPAGNYKPKKSDTGTFRRPDPSRLYAMASQKTTTDEDIVDGLVSSKKKVTSKTAAPIGLATPTQPFTPITQSPQQPGQFTVGQEVYNPADAAKYQIKAQNPDGGLTMTDPTTGQEAVVTKDQVQGLKPALRTSALTAEAILEEVIKEHLKEDIKDAEGGIKDDKKLMERLDKSSTTSLLPHIATMSKRWNETRKDLQEKFAKKTVEKSTSLETETRQTRAQRELGYSPEKLEKDKTGHDISGVPYAEDKDIVVGLTEFPKDEKRDDSSGPPLSSEKGYRVPFKKMNENQVEEREHFKNEEKLPSFRKRREEDTQYETNPKEYNYGLNDDEKQALRKELGLIHPFVKEAADEPVAEEPELKEGPIQYKPLKTAPKIKEFQEPAVIEESEGKVKEAITKYKQVQAEIDMLQKKLDETTKPLKDSLLQVSKPFNDDLAKQNGLLTSYLLMIYSQLSETKDRVAGYEESIVAAVSRVKEQPGTVSVTQLLAKAESIAPELVGVIQKVKDLVASENTTRLLERFLYEYPVSKSHEKKMSAMEGEGSVEGFIDQLVQLIQELSGINDRLIND